MDQIYIGSTNDLKNRFKEHQEGKVFSTKRYKPWLLFYYEAFKTEKLARIREKTLKHNGNALRELKKKDWPVECCKKWYAGFIPHHFQQ